MIKEAIKKLIKHADLTPNEMTDVMQEIMTGQATAAQIAGLLVGLEMKGPSVVELTAAAKVMRSMANSFSLDFPLLDIVGTGGDGAKTFNISTTCAFIVAAAGGKVAKHGNRSVSSSSGSADVLECAGINLDLTVEQVKLCIRELGLGFLFAPKYHAALQYAQAPRKELGVRTFFNLLGPLTNPANAAYLMIGVSDLKHLTLVAQVLAELKCRHALVVHSADGLDEISISAPTFVAELAYNEISEYVIGPSDLGFEMQPLSSICVENPAQSYALMLDVLNNIKGPARDIALLNSGAAIYTVGLAKTIQEGIQKAEAVLEKGLALQKFKDYKLFTMPVSEDNLSNDF